MNYKDDYIETDQKSQIRFDFFNGYFPKYPQHTCEHYGVVNAKVNSVNFTIHSQKVWRERRTKHGDILPICLGCNYKHTKRIVNQIISEYNFNPMSDWGHVVTPEQEFIKFRNRLKSKKSYRLSPLNKKEIHGNNLSELKYIALPQGSNDLMLFHNNVYFKESEMIPTNIDSLFVLVKTALLKMPARARARRSQGFGLQYGRHYNTSGHNIKLCFKSPHKVRLLIKKQKIPYGNNGYNIEILDLLKLLKDASIKFWIIEGQEIIDSLNAGVPLELVA